MDSQQSARDAANDGAPQIAELASLLNRANEMATALSGVVADCECKRTSVLSLVEDIAQKGASLNQSLDEQTSKIQTKVAELEAATLEARERADQSGSETAQSTQAKMSALENAANDAATRQAAAVAAAGAAEEQLARARQLLNEIEVAKAQVIEHHTVTVEAAAAKGKFDSDAADALDKYGAALSESNERAEEFAAAYATAKEDIARLIAQAEVMLFGATNAGIASTFKEEVSALDRRIRDAERMFLFGIFAIGISLIPLIVYMLNVSAGHELTFSSVLARSAILIPAIWLTRHFARRIHANFELRQQYVHKYSMGAIVEPFRRQAGEHASNVVAGVAEELMKNPASVLKRHQKIGDGPVDDLSDTLKPITRLLPSPDRT